jgi:hypothetical protein
MRASRLVKGLQCPRPRFQDVDTVWMRSRWRVMSDFRGGWLGADSPLVDELPAKSKKALITSEVPERGVGRK